MMTRLTIRREEVNQELRRTTTLFDLVTELHDAGACDHEVVAALVDLIQARRVSFLHVT